MVRMAGWPAGAMCGMPLSRTSEAQLLKIPACAGILRHATATTPAHPDS